MKKKKFKEKCWGVYNEISGTLHQRFSTDVEEISKYRMEMSINGKMPHESIQDSVNRHIVVQCEITFELERDF